VEAAALQIQHALDQQQQQERGPLRLRRPERTLEDVAWNAIVIGQQNRFQGEDSQAGFALQMARKLKGLGLIVPEATDDVRRILGGLLAFLWESQRITHLEPERALGQSETLRLMLNQVGAGWSVGTRALVQPLTDAVEALDVGQSAAGNKFQRALDALTSAAPTADPVADLESRIYETLERCGEISPHARAEAAAWSLGLLLERAYQARRAQPPRNATRDRLLRVYRALYREIEGWLYPYLTDGFKVIPEQYDFVQQWKWDVGKTATRKARKGKEKG
jgi:hypothetical protein